MKQAVILTINESYQPPELNINPAEYYLTNAWLNSNAKYNIIHYSEDDKKQENPSHAITPIPISMAFSSILNLGVCTW